jgi:hypothetical protein
MNYTYRKICTKDRNDSDITWINETYIPVIKTEYRKIICYAFGEGYYSIINSDKENRNGRTFTAYMKILKIFDGVCKIVNEQKINVPYSTEEPSSYFANKVKGFNI